MQSNCVLCSYLAQLAVFVWTYIELALVAGIVCALVLP
jgi:hypothetical protein